MPKSSGFCQFLSRPIEGMPLDRHRLALLGCQAVTVVTLRRILTKMGQADVISALDGVENEREELICAYLSSLHATNVDLESPSAASRSKRKTAPARAQRTGNRTADKKERGSAGSGVPRSAFQDGEVHPSSRPRLVSSRLGRRP